MDCVRNSHEHALDTWLMREAFCGDSEQLDIMLSRGVICTDVACRFFNVGPSVTVDVTTLSGTV